MDIIPILAAFLFGGILVYFFFQLRTKSAPNQTQQETIVYEPPPQPETELLPYWTVYGTPSQWPYYLSPYWYFGAPQNGPITGGYYPGHKGHPDSRGIYAPHGPRPGYSGVSVGGGGGGGGHGGH